MTLVEPALAAARQAEMRVYLRTRPTIQRKEDSLTISYSRECAVRHASRMIIVKSAKLAAQDTKVGQANPQPPTIPPPTTRPGIHGYLSCLVLSHVVLPLGYFSIRSKGMTRPNLFIINRNIPRAQATMRPLTATMHLWDRKRSLGVSLNLRQMQQIRKYASIVSKQFPEKREQKINFYSVVKNYLLFFIIC